MRSIVASGIPVMGHHGMLPQRVLEEGGYKKKGKTKAESCAILEGAHALQNAGCFSIVLESVVPELAQKIPAADAALRNGALYHYFFRHITKIHLFTKCFNRHCGDLSKVLPPDLR